MSRIDDQSARLRPSLGMYKRVLIGLGALVGCGGEAADAPAIIVTDPSGAPAAQVEIGHTNVGQS